MTRCGICNLREQGSLNLWKGVGLPDRPEHLMKLRVVRRDGQTIEIPLCPQCRDDNAAVNAAVARIEEGK